MVPWTVNDREVKETCQVMKVQPKMGLSCGEDQGPNVTKYIKETFEGEITDLVMEIK